MMEKIMRKSNDTMKTRELIEAELADVSGGYTLENCMISGFVAAAPFSIDIGTSENLVVNASSRGFR
jgi:hypothetical protein